MSYYITHKPAYDSDFLNLSKELQKRAVEAVRDLEGDPITPRGNTIKPLKGWENVWRYRLGDHRLIYVVAPDEQLLGLLAIGHRGTIYDRFSFDGWDEPNASRRFSTDLKPQRKQQFQYNENWFRPKEREAKPLPRRFTPSLLTQLHIPEAYHPTILPCRDEDQLYGLADEIPYEVWSRLIDNIEPATAEQIAQQPDLVLLDPSDLERYADGDLQTFLLRLDDRQREVTDWALRGPTLVKGGPGSGKSTVALYRIRALVEKHLNDTGEVPRIWFTTYTNALTNYSQSLLEQLLRPLNISDASRITIKNVDKEIVRMYRSTHGNFNAANGRELDSALNVALNQLPVVKSSNMERLLARMALKNLSLSYLLQEFEWVVEGQNCLTLADYKSAERGGRGIPFNASVREAVWLTYTRMMSVLKSRGLVTWGSVRQKALAAARQAPAAYDFVIIDEAQDLSPAVLAFCVEMCESPAGVCIAADANQSLYNNGFRWNRVHEGLQVRGRTRILRRNYRTTAEISLAACDILQDGDSEALTQEYVYSGDNPVAYAAKGASDQADWLAKQVYGAARALRLPINAAAILVPTHALGKSLEQQLNERGLTARFIEGRYLNLNEQCLKILTLHSAKGLEFPVVGIAHVEAGHMPRLPKTTDEKERAEHEAQQRRLFYVGATRAMRHLFISYDGAIASPFVKDLNEDRWLWDE